MLKIRCGNRMLHDPTMESGEYVFVWDISLTKKVNECDSLTFTIHDTHPESQYVYPNCEEITVEKTDWVSDEVSIIFYGRVLTTSINLNGERTVTCEGELGYLLDSIISPFLFEGVFNSEALQHILLEHNNQINGSLIDKRINIYPNQKWLDHPYLPEYDVNGDGFIFTDDARLIARDGLHMLTYFPTRANTGPGGTETEEDVEARRRGDNAASARRINLSQYMLEESAALHPLTDTWSTDGTERALDLIQRKLTEQYGGILTIRHYEDAQHNDRRGLVYTRINDGVEPSEGSSPMITIDNLLDITYDKSAEERFTMLYPLGAEITETDCLKVRALAGRTWIAFGDGSSVCKLDAQPTVLDPGDGFDSIPSYGEIGVFSATDYTGDIQSGSLVQKNIHTSTGKSYINLLTEASELKTITMAQGSETIFKHGGHKSGNDIIQDWDSDGEIHSNRDKSVVERLFDMFGPATIDDTTETMIFTGYDGVERHLTTNVATGMTLDADKHGDTINPLRLADFVTVSVGLNDWLNADSILGNNELGRKYSAYLNAAGDPQGGFTAADLFKNVSTNAIDDYFDGQLPNEDGINQEFRMTIYWQIRFLCMYLKACFPISHIIIFSSFGQKTSSDSNTDNQNKVGQTGWYPSNGNFSTDTSRKRRNFYTETVTDPYMKKAESSGDSQQQQQPQEEWDRDDTASLDDYDVIEGADSSDNDRIHKFKKVHIGGEWSKSTRTVYNITTEGTQPLGTQDEKYYAYSKVTKKTGSGESETTEPRLVWIKSWNSLDGKNVGEWNKYLPENYEGTPQIIRNPHAVLAENSYSISDINDALGEICGELGLTFIDSEGATGISVNNYSEIIGDPEDIFDDLDEDGEADDIIAQNIAVTTMPFDNLGSMSTKKGKFGESFVDGAYLNDLGQRAMARAVRDAMIECLISDGTLDSVERLTISGNEHPFYKPLSDDEDNWRCMRIVPSGCLIKPDAVYDAAVNDGPGSRIIRKTPNFVDQGGEGRYDLIDAYGDYNYRAFEDLVMTTGAGGTLRKNTELTNELIPKAPADPIVATMEFEDITDPQELFYEGAKYLYDNFGQNVLNITAKAIDMRIVDKAAGTSHDSVGSFEVGKIALITALNYGLSQSPFVIDSITESDDPSDTVVTFKSVGSSRTASDQLAANPYGPHNKRATRIKLMFAKFSDIFNDTVHPITNLT